MENCAKNQHWRGIRASSLPVSRVVTMRVGAGTNCRRNAGDIGAGIVADEAFAGRPRVLRMGS